MKRPNFFLIGAPKCGTSSLYEYLRAHPKIFMPEHKEPHFFATDLPGMNQPESVSEYERLFEPADEEHIAVGEASACHMYSTEAPRLIHEYAPDARILVMLRNPIDMVASLHQHQFLGFWEDEGDLEKAWSLQPLRKNGERIPKDCPEVRLLYYADVCKLGAQLRRAMSVFPPAQLKPILFDDFKSDTRRVYEEILAFLGVPSDGRIDFPRVNPARVHRVRWLARLCVITVGPWYRIRRAIKSLLGKRLSGAFGERLTTAYAEPSERKPLGAEMRSRLAAAFRDDVGELSDLLGRDLSHWLD